jgi:hypothetical protein
VKTAPSLFLYRPFAVAFKLTVFFVLGAFSSEALNELELPAPPFSNRGMSVAW